MDFSYVSEDVPGAPQVLQFFLRLVPGVLVRGRARRRLCLPGFSWSGTATVLILVSVPMDVLSIISMAPVQVRIRLFHEVAVLLNVQEFSLLYLPFAVQAGYLPSPLVQFSLLGAPACLCHILGRSCSPVRLFP